MARAKQSRTGSSFWKLLEAQEDTGLQKSIILYELAKYPAVTASELEQYEIWIACDKKCFPRAGGWDDQPAGIMQIFKQLDIQHRLLDRLFEVEEKEEELIKKHSGGIKTRTQDGRIILDE